MAVLRRHPKEVEVEVKLEEMPSPTAEARACLNCGEPLLHQYCGRCGQEDIDLHRPLKQLAQDAVGDLLNLDTRLLRTLGPLCFRPGFVIREYLAGRRVRFVPPLKMFLLASLVFFGLAALLPTDKMVFYREPSSEEQAPQRIDTSKEEESDFDRRVEEGLSRVQEDPEEFQKASMANLARAFFVLLPLFALLLKLFYWRRDHFYLDHLIFALYYHAFAFLALTLQMILERSWIPDWLKIPLSLVLSIWLVAYLAIALRKVYGGSRWVTFFKFTGLLAIYTLALMGTTVTMVMMTLWLY